jgi:molecular chaperone GrpE (heat shock protein)
MSDEETSAILNTAEGCVDGECSLDEVQNLISELKGTEKELSARLVKIKNIIENLQHINEKEERKTDEVRSFVKDMLRVFSSDVR